MAEEKRIYFPMLPISHWWALRKKFRQSIPGIVTDGYLATVLDMNAKSAQVNVLPYLKRLGIINDDGKTTDRAKNWRDDGHYPQVCKDILAEVYPQELRDAVTDPGQREAAERWFANETGTGEVAARRMGALYILLLEADPSKQPEEERGDRPRRPERAVPAEVLRERPAMAAAARARVEPPQNHGGTPGAPQVPSININLEIHISADSTPEQIDQIFASMAKHIYKAG